MIRQAAARPLLAHTELAPAPVGTGTVVASLCHVSDLHVVDVASPMRFEWIETVGHDPRWRPLLHMHRPQESLVAFAVAAHVDVVRRDPTGAVHGSPLDLVVSTGDNIDNAQRNELDAYLALLAGGVVELPPAGGPQDATGRDPDEPWPYWSPRAEVDDTWKHRGYPVVPDLLERAAEPLRSLGLGVPWTSLPGNHDLLCQGTSLVNDALLALATGGTKGLQPPVGFLPDDALALFVERPEVFVGHGDRPVTPDPRRRAISRAEWTDCHVAAGAVGWTPGHGAASRSDTVVDLDEVSIVVLDTNHPHGDYQGSVGTGQLAWLDQRLTEIDAAGRLAVLASHHGPESLVNTRGADPARVLAEPMLDVVHGHPCVVAWLVGHRHIHRVTPRPGRSGGFWEITTASLIDWPVERRSVEVLRHTDGTVEIVCCVDAHGASADSLAGVHRTVAERFAGSQVRSAMAGTELDRDVRLFVAR